jgi:hypothetical protein
MTDRSAEIHAALSQVREQLHLLGLKEILVRENVTNDFSAFEALAAKLAQLEAENGPFFEEAIRE